MAFTGLNIRVGFVGTLREKALAIRDRAVPVMSFEFRMFVIEVFRASQGAVTGRMLQLRSGHLRRSGYLDMEQGSRVLSAAIGYRAKYARWLHDGTRPYTIRPRSAGASAGPGSVVGSIFGVRKAKSALRFMVAGKAVFAKSVRHPGLVGRPFLAGPVVAHRPLFVERMREAIMKTINEA